MVQHACPECCRVWSARPGCRWRSTRGRVRAGRDVAKLFQLLTYTAVGTPGEVSDYLEGFLQHTGADELITAHHALTIEARLRSVTLLAEAMQTVTA